MDLKALKAQVGMERLQVAKVYAEALWNSSEASNATKEVYEEFTSLYNDVIESNVKVKEFFERSASIGQRSREAVIRKSFEKQCSDLLFSFLMTLNKHDRLDLIDGVYCHLIDSWNRSKNIVPVYVESAADLNDKQKDRLKSILAKELKIEPDMNYEIVPKLLGGLRVQVGDMVYDRSIRWNLERLKDNLMKRSSNEIQSGRNLIDSSN